MKATISLICTLCFASLQAATWHDPQTGYTWTYETRDGGVVIENHPPYTSASNYERAVSPTPTGHVVVPKQINGTNVVAIGIMAFCHCEELTSVVIPTNVTRIAMSAFNACYRLGSVEGSDHVQYIGMGAFQNCGSLSNFVWSTELEEIDEHAFLACEKLAAVDFAEGLKSIGRQSFNECEALREVTIPGSVTNLDYNAFHSCIGLEKLIVQDGVNCLKAGSFYGCTALTSIKLPASVVSIDGAFGGCANIREVAVPTIFPLEYAFRDSYENISKITIPSYATNICANAYAHLRALTNIVIPAGIRSIGSCAFEGTGLYELNLPTDIAALPYGLCMGCENLKSIAIPDSVGEIGQFAFSGCLGLTSVEIPGSVTNHGGNAFSGCHNIRDVRVGGNIILMGALPDSYEQITNAVVLASPKSVASFTGCVGLMSVTIPEGIEEIRDMAFHRCSSLQSIKLPKSVNKIGSYAFFGCTSLTELELPDDIKNVPAGMLQECSGITSVVIPEGVTNIGDMAFYLCSSLRSIVIPESVKTIGGNAFTECENIRDVVIPSSFGMYIFPNYTEITHAAIADGATSIANNAFSYCTKLESVRIPPTVETIGEYAFQSCGSLTSLKIPASVQTIGKSAFAGCNCLEWMSFDGMPPANLADTEINTEMLIWYNADYASKWREEAENVGLENVQAFMPRTGQCIEPRHPDTVHVVVTNVVVHLIQRAEESSAVIPDSVDAGFVTIVTEIKGGAVSIPSTWKNNYPEFEQIYGTDYAKAYTQKSGKVDAAGNELLVWQDFVAGTDPTDENDVFQATVTIVDGKPVIHYSPELSEAETAKRKYTTWGKVRLQDSTWTIVAPGTESDFNFFKVSVEMR